MQKEYMRGISGWNFNLEDLKAQAALVILLAFSEYYYSQFYITDLIIFPIFTLQIQSSDTFSTTEDFDKDQCESANFEATDIVRSENVNNSEAANVREVNWMI